MTGHRQRRLRFHRCAQPQQGEGQARLHDLADGLPARGEGGEEDGVELLFLGQAAHTHRGVGDDPQTALRAEEHLAQIGAGGGSGKGRGELQRARGSEHPPAGEELLDTAVAEGLLPAGTRGDPAAEGGVLEGLGIVPQRVAARPQLRFEIGSHDAGAEGRQLTPLVEAEEAVHTGQIEGEDGLLPGQGIDVAHDTCSAPVGYEAQLALGGEVEERLHLGRILWVGNAVGEDADLPAAQRHPIGQALPPGVTQARLGIGADELVRR